MSVGGCFFQRAYFLFKLCSEWKREIKGKQQKRLIILLWHTAELLASIFFLCSKFRTASQQSLSIKLYIVFHFFVLLSFFALILAWHSKKSPLFSVLKLHVLCCTVKMTFFIHPLSSQLSRAIINSIYFLHLYFNYSEQLTP